MKKDTEILVHEILLENYDKYYRIAFGYVHNEEDALDIVQEGAYKAIFYAEKLKQPEYADTWICRIMMNEAVEFLRKNDRNYVEFDTCEMGKSESYENIDLRNAIDALSQNERAVVQLRYFEEMSLQQVAQVVGENLSTVKSRLYRALSKLRISLEEV